MAQWNLRWSLSLVWRQGWIRLSDSLRLIEVSESFSGILSTNAV